MTPSQQPQTSTLFRTSLRDWKEQWKARQGVPKREMEQGPTREKKLMARKKRKMKRAGEVTRS